MTRKNAFVALILIILLTPSLSFSWPVPDTGQTISYPAISGEDSDYTINPLSYTKLGENGVELPDTATLDEGWLMTRDNVTGLVWEMKTDDGSIHDKDNKFSWYDPNPETNGGFAGLAGNGTDTLDFISGLNDAHFGGYSDWRMPTRKELRSIVNFGTNNPSIDNAFFPHTVGSIYWSSDSKVNDGNAWGVLFDYGYDNYYEKGYNLYVRAVRGERTIPSLIDNSDGTVTDSLTGLMWQKQDDGLTRTWASAISYCEGLTMAGYDDWRMPNIKELDSIVDLSRFNPAIDPVFIETKSSRYWSSSDNPTSSDYAWCINFYHGIVGPSPYGKSDSTYIYIRAVRSGQIQSSDHLIILDPTQGDIWTVGETKTISWNPQQILGNVDIILSRDGGKTFTEIISSSTPNDGSFEWTVSGAPSYNCVLKIIPLNDADKAAAQGVFTIQTAPLAIETQSIPAALQKSPFQADLEGSGGIPPYSWSIESGDLPEGIALGSATGQLSGTPDVCGTSNFTVQLSDSAQTTTTRAFTLSVTCCNDYDISGKISNGFGAAVTMTGDGSKSTTVDETSNFIFQHLENGTYVITPSKDYYHFEPEFLEIILNNRDVLNADFIAVAVDTDTDGMPDFWEIQYGLNALDPSDKDQDLDNDGLTNYEEYVRGSDPTNYRDPHSKIMPWLPLLLE